MNKKTHRRKKPSGRKKKYPSSVQGIRTINKNLLIWKDIWMYWSDCFTVSHTSVHPPANAAQTDGETVHMLIDFFFPLFRFQAVEFQHKNHCFQILWYIWGWNKMVNCGILELRCIRSRMISWLPSFQSKQNGGMLIMWDFDPLQDFWHQSNPTFAIGYIRTFYF